MTADKANLPEPRKLVLLVCGSAFNKHAQRISAYYSRQNSQNVVVVCNAADAVNQFLRTFRYKYTGKACCWFCDVYIHYIGSGADLACNQQSPLSVKLDACTLDLWNIVCMEVCKYQRPLLVLDCTSPSDIMRRLEQVMAASFVRNLPLVLAPSWQLTDATANPPAPPAAHGPHHDHVGVLSRQVARQKPFQQWHAHHAVVVGATNVTFKPKDDADVLRLLGVALFAGCAYIRATDASPAPPDAGPTVLFTKASHFKHARTLTTTGAPVLPQHLLGPSPFTVHHMHAARPTCDQRLPALELYRDWVAAGRELVTFLRNAIASFNEAVTHLKVQASPTDLATPAARAAFTARFTHAAPVLSRLPTLLLALAHPPAAALAPHAFTAFTTTLLRLLGLPDCLPLALAPLTSLDLRRLLSPPPAPRPAPHPPHHPHPSPAPPPTCLLPLALCLLLWLDPLPTFDLLANISHVPHSFLHFILAFVHGAVPLPEVLTQLGAMPGADRIGSILQHVYSRRIVRAELAQNLDAQQRAALAGVLPYHVVPDGIPVCHYSNLVAHYKRAVRHALQDGAAAAATGGDGAA